MDGGCSEGIWWHEVSHHFRPMFTLIWSPQACRVMYGLFEPRFWLWLLQPSNNAASMQALLDYRDGKGFSFMTKEFAAHLHPVCFGACKCRGNKVRTHSYLDALCLQATICLGYRLLHPQIPFIIWRRQSCYSSFANAPHVLRRWRHTSSRLTSLLALIAGCTWALTSTLTPSFRTICNTQWSYKNCTQRWQIYPCAERICHASTKAHGFSLNHRLMTTHRAFTFKAFWLISLRLVAMRIHTSPTSLSASGTCIWPTIYPKLQCGNFWTPNLQATHCSIFQLGGLLIFQWTLLINNSVA